MLPFSVYLLRQYYRASGWNDDNQYSQLTRSSRALLDFNFEPGLHFSLSKNPVPSFATSASLSALSPIPNDPIIQGSLSYFFARPDISLSDSANAPLKQLTDRFIPPRGIPPPPSTRPPAVQGGKLVDKDEYLLYGRLSLPSSRVDGLCIYRLSPTLLSHITFISTPSESSSSLLSLNSTSSTYYPAAATTSTTTTTTATTSASASTTASTTSSSSSSSKASPFRSPSNIMVNLQHDNGRWSSEYSYSVADGMFGARFLHNFGTKLNSSKLASTRTSATTTMSGTPESSTTTGNNIEESSASRDADSLKRVDEEESLSRGLNGTFSAGAECFFSALESSGGISAGVRFATLPNVPPASYRSSSTDDRLILAQAQPPTVITATLNPIVGALQAAYTTNVSNDLTLCSRYDFNVYSYYSDWTMGLEWWQRARTPQSQEEIELEKSLQEQQQKQQESSVEAAAPTRTNVADLPAIFWRTAIPSSFSISPPTSSQGEIVGLFKARASTGQDLALKWERRLGSCVVGMGVVANLTNPSHPLRSIGLDIQYFSDGSQ